MAPLTSHRPALILYLLAAGCVALCCAPPANLKAEPADKLDTVESLEDAYPSASHEQLAAKREALVQLLRFAREIARAAKHRPDAERDAPAAVVHDAYLLDTLGGRIADLIAEIAEFEDTASEPEAKSPTVQASSQTKQENEIARLVEDLKTKSPARVTATKQFFWPLEGKILSSPGTSIRRGGARWPGILMASAPHATVRSIASGRVVYAGEMKQLGLLVILDHEDGHLSLYGKNAELLVKTDQYIDKDEAIAVIGDGSGGQTQEFYFEIRRDRRPVDPRKVCSKRVDSPSVTN